MMAVALLAAGVPQGAAAWDGITTQKIIRIDITAGQSLGFRVFGKDAMCGPATPSWAFMNKNYDAAAALFTTSWIAQKSVMIHAINDGGYCRIGYVTFS